MSARFFTCVYLLEKDICDVSSELNVRSQHGERELTGFEMLFVLPSVSRLIFLHLQILFGLVVFF